MINQSHKSHCGYLPYEETLDATRGTSVPTATVASSWEPEILLKPLSESVVFHVTLGRNEATGLFTKDHTVDSGNTGRLRST